MCDITPELPFERRNVSRRGRILHVTGETVIAYDGSERLQIAEICSKQSGTTENPPLQSREGIVKAFFYTYFIKRKGEIL